MTRDHTHTPEYQAAVKAAADQITLSESQKAILATLLNPRALIRVAVAARPDLPVGIRHQEVTSDGGT